MAYINSSAIRGAIVDRLEGVIGGVRSVSQGEVEADIIEGAADSTKAFRALLRPVFTVEFQIDKHQDSPMGPTSLMLFDVKVRLLFTYNLKGQEPQTVDYADRKAVAERHVSVFSEALTWPGALTTCLSTGQATGIASGMLLPGSPLYRVVNDDPDQAIFEIEQNYSAVVRVDAATS